MHNTVIRFRIWSSRRNIWIYLSVLLLLGLYGIFKFTSGRTLSRLDAMLLYGKNVKAQISTSKSGTKLLVNTTGCKLDLIAPFDKRYPEILKYFSREEPTRCITDKPPLSYLKHGMLHIDNNVLSKHYPDVRQCTYKTIHRDPSDANWVLFGEETTLQLNEGSKINDDFVAVYCNTKTGYLTYRDVHKQIVPKESFNGVTFPKRGPDEMNVVLIILESISRLNWIRQCPDLHEYITNSLGGIMFNGMNKLEDNTVPNVYAMVTGKNVNADWQRLMFSNVDNLGWIWKEAEQKGYVSQLSEEVTKVKRPTWVKNFKHSAAVHHHRPIRVFMAREPAIPKGSEEDNHFCYGSRTQLGLKLDWTLELLNNYRDKKTFAIVNIDEVLGSHMGINKLSTKEHVFMDFFKKLKDSTILNDTLVIVVGDHGFRIGDYFGTAAGEYEARLPLLSVIPPKLLKDKFPESYSNLVQNAQNRIVSPLDIWKTLKSVIHKQVHPVSAASNSGPGSSLFWHIPEERTCEGAGIPQHWCACGSYVTIPNSDPRAQKVGSLLIQSINQITTLEEDLCVKYHDFIVKDARIKLPVGDIFVVIQTRPIVANFRASVSVGATNPVITSIERLDKYAGVVKCLANTKHRDELLPKTCICKDAV